MRMCSIEISNRLKTTCIPYLGRYVYICQEVTVERLLFCDSSCLLVGAMLQQLQITVILLTHLAQVGRDDVADQNLLEYRFGCLVK